MPFNRKAPLALTCGIIGFGLLFLCAVVASAQQPGNGSRTLRVAVIEAPPAFIKTAGNQWEGLSVELWQAVAQELDVAYAYREFDDSAKLLAAFEKGEIDLILALPVHERFVDLMEFSQSYLKSGLSIAVPAEVGEYTWVRIFEGLLSREGLKAIGVLLLMSLVAGVAVWLFERRRNSDMFGKRVVHGVGHGIWWAMVTMTTVGYGDKAPQTLGGRAVALLWMIFSVVFLAVFTANITSSLTVHQLSGNVQGFNDLFRARVGALRNSEGIDFLSRKGISVVPFEHPEQGLRALTGKRIDAFVHDEQLLKHIVRKEFPGKVQVLPDIFDEYFVSMALQPDNPLRKPVNEALLHFMKSPQWTELLNRYLK
jgi:ABC-type amino acid transport substrate-binding protein